MNKEVADSSGVPFALDTVSASVMRPKCISATMLSSIVSLSGLHKKSSMVPVADVIRREIVLKGLFAYSPINFSAAIDLLAAAIHLDLWTVKALLEKGEQSFNHLANMPRNRNG